MHSNTNLVASRAVKREKVSLPVNEHRLKKDRCISSLTTSYVSDNTDTALFPVSISQGVGESTQIKTSTVVLSILKHLNTKTQPIIFVLIAELSRARSAQRSTMGKKVW